MRPAPGREPLLLAAIAPSVALGLLNGFYLPALTRVSPALYWAADVLQFVVVPGVAFWLLTGRGGFRPHELGLGRLGPHGSWPRAVGLVLLATALYWLAYEPVVALVRTFFPGTEASVPFVDVLPHSQPWRWLAVLYASGSAALVEETVFRSIPWRYFSARLRAPHVPYVLVTSVLFAAIHSEQGIPAVIGAGSVGIVAAALYTRIRNVWPFVVAHFAAGAWLYPWL